MANEPQKITKKGCAKAAIYFFGGLFLVSILTVVMQLLFSNVSEEEVTGLRTIFWLLVIAIVLFALFGGKLSDILDKKEE